MYARAHAHAHTFTDESAAFGVRGGQTMNNKDYFTMNLHLMEHQTFHADKTSMVRSREPLSPAIPTSRCNRLPL
eukprot:6175482-Pleurochrysis_carterae.AAC.1